MISVQKKIEVTGFNDGCCELFKKKKHNFFCGGLLYLLFSLIFFTLIKKLNIFIYSLILIWFLNSIIIF